MLKHCERASTVINILCKEIIKVALSILSFTEVNDSSK